MEVDKLEQLHLEMHRMIDYFSYGVKRGPPRLFEQATLVYRWVFVMRILVGWLKTHISGLFYYVDNAVNTPEAEMRGTGGNETEQNPESDSDSFSDSVLLSVFPDLSDSLEAELAKDPVVDRLLNLYLPADVVRVILES